MQTDNNITLRQALEKFYQENAHKLSHNKNGVSSEAKTFFLSHDIAHVLFACDTTLFGEGAVKIWTIFGTTLGFWKHIRGYQEADALELSKDFGLGHVLANVFAFLVAIPRLIIRAKRMNKPWPWAGFEPYLDRPLSEIREEFNICTLSR
ncbi:MAG: hypothetical protein AAFV95_21905 [Bacteroidota bacterium]